MVSSPVINDGASTQEDNEEASTSHSSDEGTQRSHSEATAENDSESDDAATGTEEDDDGVHDSDAQSQSKMDLAPSDEDDGLPEHSDADEQDNSFQSDDNDDSVSEKSESEDLPGQPIKSADAAEGTSSPSSPPPAKLGGLNGSNGIPAYALLVGMLDPDMSDCQETISIPIKRIPITLGKQHATKDPSFFGLKECSDNNENETPAAAALSQSMCCIFYRDAHGGKLGLYKKGRKKENDNNVAGGEKGGITADLLEGMIYKPCEQTTIDENEKTNSVSHPEDVLRLPNMDPNAPLPPSGFFAIECTGRNIIVGGRVMKKGQVAMLNNGMPIRIGPYCLYFLLPKSSTLKPPPSIKVKLAATQQIKPEKVTSSTLADKKDSESSMGSIIEKDDSVSLPAPPAKKSRKSEEFLVSTFDDKSDAQLLALLSEKVTQATWDHEGQKLGSTLATRVCRAAAKSSQIQGIVRNEGGVTQREIIDWMNDPSNVFNEYEPMMLGKIVEKSFMMSMGKAILRAGYTKNEYLSGRAFRWNLPEDIPMSGLKEERESLPLGMGDVEGGNDLEALENNVKEEESGSASNQSAQDDGGSDNNMESDEEAGKDIIDAVTSSKL